MNKDATQLRAKIMKTFDALLYKQGYEQSTLRQLADECGIGRGHLYFYFARKEQLSVALRRDLLTKIDIILADSLRVPGEEGLLPYFLSLLVVRYLIAKKPELYRTQAEYASHTQVLDGFAEMQYARLDNALKSLGLSINRDLIEESILSATYGEYALIKHRHRRAAPPMDHVFLFRYFTGILFSQMSFLSGTVDSTRNRAIQLFDGCAQQIMQKVYEMDGYNYAPPPDETPPA